MVYPPRLESSATEEGGDVHLDFLPPEPKVKIFKLAWEPEGVIVSPNVYPTLVVNYKFSYFSLKKWTHSTYNLKKAKNIPVDLPSTPIKISDKSVKGLLSYDRTKITTLYIQIMFNYFYKD